MKYDVQQMIDINSLMPGTTLENDIYYMKLDIILYKKGTILTQSKIERLKKFKNIMFLKDPNKNDSVIVNCEDIVVRNNELDFEELHRLAKYIVISVLNRCDLKRILAKVDKNTYIHSYHVAIISTMIGINLESFNRLHLEELAMTALLHDIGKSIIDPDIINKKGSLTEEEYRIIQAHPQLGYDILMNTGLFSEDVCKSVLSHHENEDGSGYPNRKKNSEIPLYARIVHLTDVYSALISQRSYKAGWPANKAVEYIESESFKYELHLIEILKNSLPIYFKNDLVYLSNGELATVFDAGKEQVRVKMYGDKKIVNIDYGDSKIYIKRKINVS